MRIDAREYCATMSGDEDDLSVRFGAVERVFGRSRTQCLATAHLCVIGLGGVGSWAAESLARSGIGALTLIDGDRAEASNVNRQIHAMTGTFDQPKSLLMAERIRAIHPGCRCTPIDAYVTADALGTLLDQDFDGVIDAIDSVTVKAGIIAQCHARGLPVVTVGGAGGKRDPTAVRIDDLARTIQDPLAARVRQRLRRHHGFPPGPGRRFGVDCVFSSEPPRYPQADGEVGPNKPVLHGVSLDCRFGYGSVCTVTATFGLAAAACLMERIMDAGTVADANQRRTKNALPS